MSRVAECVLNMGKKKNRDFRRFALKQLFSAPVLALCGGFFGVVFFFFYKTCLE